MLSPTVRDGSPAEVNGESGNGRQALKHEWASEPIRRLEKMQKNARHLSGHAKKFKEVAL
jgi:hypothetical protein